MESQEISKELKCIAMRNGAEIWKEQDRLNALSTRLIEGQKIGFIEIDGEVINSVDIVGIFTARTMEDVIRRKNGQWRGRDGKWHDRGERACPHCHNILPPGKLCGNCGG